MKITVSIVHYKTPNILLKCLKSVFVALQNIDSEVIVVDNFSEDNAKEIVLQKFLNVKWIQNSENLGFGKAHNQALKMAQGEYVCILNPDTIIPENIFTDILQFYTKTNNIGLLGVQMKDENNRFLPESKRNIPTLQNAIYRFIPLKIFTPKKEYYATHIAQNQTAKVEVLSGAFMFTTSKIYKEINGFDERFFMFAEDIDISIHALQKGYQNYYLGNLEIIHLKGKSTEKDPNYHFRFYEAMLIFVDKHYTSVLKKMMIKSLIRLQYYKKKLFG